MSKQKRIRERSPGVSEKKRKHDDSDSDEGFSGMERPTLVGQIKAVLDEYPDDGQILKELIQNAEDADAKDVKILFDSRQISEPKDLKPDESHLKAFKAPAVCVYNDGVFTKEDWRGIKQIQMSVKANKPLKVGRFGLGFKSVFHMTDFPCIVSGNSMLIINPTQKVESTVCYKKKLKSLSEKEKKSLLKVLNGNVGFKEKDLNKGYFRGTILWFPLRTAIPKTESCVINTPYSDKKVYDLFRAFRAEASVTLLFLKSVNSIELQTRKRDSLKTVFSVWAKLDQPGKREQFSSDVKDQEGKIATSSIEARNYMTVNESDMEKKTKSEKRWLVISFYKGGRVSEELSSLCSNLALSYCPYVGLAVPLEQNVNAQGRLFCFLPLPKERDSPTGLKLHINGFFALSQNRRHVKWPSAEHEGKESNTDKALQWNQCLIEEVLPEVYCLMIKELISFCKQKGNPEALVRDVYGLMPDENKIHVHWRPLITQMYSLLASGHDRIFYTPNGNGMWVQASEAVFLDPAFSKTLVQTLVKVFTDYKKNVVQIQAHLHNVFTSLSEIVTVTPQELSALLLSGNIYEKLDRTHKLIVLGYLLTTDAKNMGVCLRNLHLLPVANGHFKKFGSTDPVYFCEDKHNIRLFPGLEGKFVSQDIENVTLERLSGLASDGNFGLKKFIADDFKTLLQECMSLHFQGTEILLTNKLTLKWLERVWTYIAELNMKLSVLDEVSLIPQDASKSQTRLLRLNETLIVRSLPTMTSLPKNVFAALQKLKVVVISNLPDFITKYPPVLGRVINCPNPEGVAKSLGEFPHEQVPERVKMFNDSASDDEKTVLIEILGTQKLNPKAKSVLKKLKIFATSSNPNLNTNLDSLHQLAPKETFPVVFPVELLLHNSEMSTRLALELGATYYSLEEAVHKTLEIISEENQTRYTEEEVEGFMIMFLISTHPELLKRPSIHCQAKKVRFLSSLNGVEKHRACDLFDPDVPLLKSLFLKESMFPVKRQIKGDNTKEILVSLGLKTKRQVTEENLCNTATLIEHLYDSKYKHVKEKAVAFLTILDSNVDRFPKTRIQQLVMSKKCIPCISSRPGHYPKGLHFFCESNAVHLESGNNTYSKLYLNLIASVASVAEHIPGNVEEILRQPPVFLVLDHLHNISESYNPKNSSSIMILLDDIYDYLSQIPTFTGEDLDRISRMKSVWTGKCFKSPRFVYLSGEMNLSPYRMELQEGQMQHRDFFLRIGCHEDQNSKMLVDVLLEVKDRHDNGKVDRKTSKRDLTIVIAIIKVLSDKTPAPEGILLPVHTDNLRLLLKPVDQCTYCNADWLKDQTETEDEGDEDTFLYVHEDISEHTARKLGVKSLTDRVLTDTENLDMNFGQKEPLTRRLKNLLKDYSDGFSVPKELLQNADDAGATEVKFMYDERENKEARTCLMHDKMESLQGPALWTFNNAQFTPEDLNNITKLSGATKENDVTKVGRFGLGFNAVYNITDVPNFISGSTVVIFDPHESYLGKPGIRADLSSLKNKSMLKKMKGQFKPYEGIFGCQIQGSSSGEICKGTLFRFPLRTRQQAVESDISSLSYDSDEMKRFIKVFAEGAGNLLLFTQNVKSVEFYHLGNSSKKIKPTLIFRVSKKVADKVSQTQSSEVVPVNGSVLSYAKSFQETKGLSILERCTITVLKKKNNFLNDSIESSMSWNIAWKFGEGASDQFAKSGKLQGLLPLAAAAVPMSKDKQHIGTLHQNSGGFYKKGHLFCFLPLPIETPLPVHINASFALNSNRKNLCCRSEDDKEILFEVEWNESLADDAIPLAYIDGIAKLPSDKRKDFDSYFNLWPRSNCKEGFQQKIFKSFYRVIMQSPKRVFIDADTGKGVAFQEGILLDPGLRFHRKIGVLAFQAFSQFKQEEDMIIDIPEEIIKSIKQSGQRAMLYNRIMTEYDFFKNIFLPNFSDAFWANEARDEMVIHVLANTELTDLLISRPCIPTKPYGNFKKPEDLVHPKGKAAILYDEEDEVFPLQTFETQFSTLCKLGMKEDCLPLESIIERSKTVARLQDTHKSTERSLNILRYLSQTTETRIGSKRQKCGYRYEQYPADKLKNQLKSIPFLPVLQKPKSWPFEWAGKSAISTASDLYFQESTNLVSASMSILGIDTDSPYRKLLKWLGVKGDSEVDLDTVIHQLLTISKLPPMKIFKENKLEMIFNGIYSYLNKKCDGNIEYTLRTKIGEASVLLVGNKTVSVQKVAFKLPFDLSPHLFKVDAKLTPYTNFLRGIGVRDDFEISDVMALLKDISKDVKSRKLTKEEAECIGRVTSFLNELLQSTDSLQNDDIRLIGSDMYLHQPSSLCIDDCEWLRTNSTMNFLHRLVNESVARKLGVKTKREADLGLYRASFMSFGQKEKLTTRLKRILTGYPFDSSVMKELLQNADDAKASQLMFIKDFRTHSKKKILSKEWSALQGPALCVYNDSYFKEEDFQGIQDLGEGSKSEDPVQTGQYGVGFNAVYHLTDAPSFITVGPKTEKTLCIFDPTLKYVPEASEYSPGVMYINLSELEKKYPDVFPCYLQNHVDLTTKGTLFRFPLRKQSSDISEEIVTEDDINNITDSFHEDMLESLLFLQNVRKISISSIDSKGKLSREYEVKMDISETDKEKMTHFQKCLNKHSSKLKGTGGNLRFDVDCTEVQIVANICDSRTMKQQKWLVIHRVGFDTDKDIPFDVQNNQAKIGLLPRGGVAVPLSQGVQFEAKGFCILPLPLKTSLPMHVNGHFALNYETRRSLWNGSDYRKLWNDLIATQVIVPAYLSAMIHVRDKILKVTPKSHSKQQLDWYHSLFPDIPNATDDFWKSLMKSIYVVMIKKNQELFPVLTSQTPRSSVLWVSVNNERRYPGLFNTLNRFLQKGAIDTGMHKRQDQETFEVELKNILSKVGMKVLEAPLRILHNIKLAGLMECIECVTPENVIKFLRSHRSSGAESCHVGELPKTIKDTSIGSVRNLELLVQFCLKGNNFLLELDGLPLALNEKLTLQIFDSTKPLILTDFPHLVSGSASQVLHKDFFMYFSSCKSDCLKKMNIETFASLLPQTLHPEVLKVERPVPWPEDIKIEWITEVWYFLTREREKRKRLHLQDTKELILSHLGQWCLIPSKLSTSSGFGYYLYPPQAGREVLNAYSVYDHRLATELQRLPIPHLWLDSLREFDSVITEFVASQNHPDTVLYALSSTFLEGQVGDSDAILRYFSDNLQELKVKLKKDYMCSLLRTLPIFRTLQNSLVSICQLKDVYALEKYDNIPDEGMELVTKKSNTAILRVTEVSRPLLLELQITQIDPSDLYIDIVLPHFDEIKFPEKCIHLEYVRDILLNDIHKHNDGPLKRKLKTLKFIPTEDEQYLPADKFYDRENGVFKVMCKHSDFPSAPFHELKWKRFLKQAGLQCKVTTAMFLAFAKQVEREGKFEITDMIEKRSVSLVSHLCKHQSDLEEDFLQQIRDIRFILPYSLEKEKGVEGRHLIKIHKQPEHKLVSFCESVSPDHSLLIWSTCQLVSKTANCILKTSSVRTQLGVSDKPSLTLVIKHIQNVTTSLNNMSLFKTAESSEIPTLTDVVTEVMTSLYKHLKELGVTDEIKNQLKEYSTIFIHERGSMMKAEEVVVDLLAEDEIIGYIERAPLFFGQFFSVFQNLGAAPSLNMNSCLKALEKLQSKTADQKLHPNEIQVVEKTLKLFIRCLDKKEDEWKVQCLYLPNDECILKDASSLTVCDEKALRERVRSLPLDMLDYLLDFKNCIPDFPQDWFLKYLNLIPEKYRPTLLTSVVEEIISNDSKDAAVQGNMSQRYKQLTTGEFISALVRLVQHEHCTEGKDDVGLSGLEIEERITKIRILDVPRLQTVLQYKGIMVPDSIVERKIFLDTSSESEKGILYLNADKKNDDIVHTLAIMEIATMINMYLDDCLKNKIPVIEKMLQGEPKDLQRLLDELKINSCNFTSSFSAKSVYPPLGSFVEKEFHWMLENSFNTLEVGEYVAVEIFDPYDGMQNGEDDNDSDPVFIYAKVKQVLSSNENSSPMLKKYLLHVGEERTEEVQATRIYKFCRERYQKTETDTSEVVQTNDAVASGTDDLESILKDIRTTLKEAWTSLGQKDRDRVRKRLYLKWHPDKNPGREDLCNEICKMIQLYIEKLNKGEDIDIIKTPHKSTSFWRGYSSDPCFNHMNKRSKRNKSHYDNYWKSHGNSSSSSFDTSYSEPFTPQPQPLEAKRWLRQAQRDLAAAKEALGTSTAHNWTCFKCQQAAEKSIKALWYNTDSRRADRLRKHNLSDLAQGLNNTELYGLTAELQSVIVDFNRLRYPDRLAFPSIPADQYTKEDAVRAENLAEKILQLVERLLT